MKSALIFGISGQDGAYLARHLLERDYCIYGTSRDTENNLFLNLQKIGVHQDVKIFSASLNDLGSIISILKIAKPDEIYNLAGQSSVGLSFELPGETFNSITLGTVNILEAIRIFNPSIKYYNAGSCECFGDTEGRPATEETRFAPKSPYAVAKAASHWYVDNYRKSYNIFACTGILFNHESILRPEHFVTMKIINAAKKIAKGEQKKLELGNVNIERDWGWAPEYVSAMHLMMQKDHPSDYVIATGEKHSLKEFISSAFSVYNLDYRQFLEINNSFQRPSDIAISYGAPTKASLELGWEAKLSFNDLIIKLMEE